jgi:predicted RNA binding protein YcfA (HicA-like mRNA interferase family)
VSERLPVLSGQQLIDALEKVGWVAVRQRGSHVRLKHDERTIPLVVPLPANSSAGRSRGSSAMPGSTATISGSFSERHDAGDPGQLRHRGRHSFRALQDARRR